MEVQSMKDLEFICRTCFNNSETMIAILTTSAMDEKLKLTSYGVQLIELTQIEITEDDKLPKYVCKSCADEISKFHEFRSRTIHNDEYLKGIVKDLEELEVKQEDVMEGDEEYLMSDSEADENEAFGVSKDEESVEVVEKIDKENQVKLNPEAHNSRVQCPECKKMFSDKKTMNIHMRFHTGKNLKYCEKCKRGFLKQAHLDRHMEQHGEPRKCEFCDLIFDMKRTYKIHVNQMHKKDLNKLKNEQRKNTLPSHELLKKIVICKICDTNFNEVKGLKEHLRTHEHINTLKNLDLSSKSFLFDKTEISSSAESDLLLNNLVKKIKTGHNQYFYQIISRDGQELNLSDSDTETEQESFKKYTCSACGAVFNRSKYALAHMNSQHNSISFPDKCEKCEKNFPCSTLLERHLKDQCKNQEKSFLCSKCGMKFLWSNSLELHQSLCLSGTSTTRYVCECGKTFLKNEHFVRHQKLHDSSEKYKCPGCEKLFNRKDNLQQHMKIHEPGYKVQKSYLCTVCGRGFSNSSNLIVHTRRHNPQNNPYKCDLCPKTFPRSADLVCHRRSHTGERPFLCNICGKKFSVRGKLQRHERVHSKVKPYQCPYCERCFSQSNDLTIHIRRHKNVKPYRCGDCEESFVQRQDLKKHQRKEGHVTEHPDNFELSKRNSVDKLEKVNVIHEGKQWKIELLEGSSDGQQTIRQLRTSGIKKVVEEVADTDKGADNEIKAGLMQKQSTNKKTRTSKRHKFKENHDADDSKKKSLLDEAPDVEPTVRVFFNENDLELDNVDSNFF